MILHHAIDDVDDDVDYVARPAAITVAMLRTHMGAASYLALRQEIIERLADGHGVASAALEFGLSVELIDQIAADTEAP